MNIFQSQGKDTRGPSSWFLFRKIIERVTFFSLSFGSFKEIPSKLAR